MKYDDCVFAPHVVNNTLALFIEEPEMLALKKRVIYPLGDYAYLDTLLEERVSFEQADDGPFPLERSDHGSFSACDTQRRTCWLGWTPWTANWAADGDMSAFDPTLDIRVGPTSLSRGISFLQ